MNAPIERFHVVRYAAWLMLVIGLAGGASGCIEDDDDPTADSGTGGDDDDDNDDDDDDDDDTIDEVIDTPDPMPPIDDPDIVDNFSGNMDCQEVLPTGVVGETVELWQHRGTTASFVPCNQSLLATVGGDVHFSSFVANLPEDQQVTHGLGPGGWLLPIVMQSAELHTDGDAQTFFIRSGLQTYRFTRAAADEPWSPQPDLPASLVETEEAGQTVFTFGFPGGSQSEYRMLDGLYRPVRQINPDGTEVLLDIDASGDWRITDRRGLTTKIEFEDHGAYRRVQSISVAGESGPRLTLVYDGDNLSSVVHPGGVQWQVSASSGTLTVHPPGDLGMILTAHLAGGRFVDLADDFTGSPVVHMSATSASADEVALVTHSAGGATTESQRWWYATADSRFRYLASTRVGAGAAATTVSHTVNERGCLTGRRTHRGDATGPVISAYDYTPDSCPRPASTTTLATTTMGMTIQHTVKRGIDWFVLEETEPGSVTEYTYYGVAEDGMSRLSVEEAPHRWAYGRVVHTLETARGEVVRDESVEVGTTAGVLVAVIEDNLHPVMNRRESQHPTAGGGLETAIDGVAVAWEIGADGHASHLVAQGGMGRTAAGVSSQVEIEIASRDGYGRAIETDVSLAGGVSVAQRTVEHAESGFVLSDLTHQGGFTEGYAQSGENAAGVPAIAMMIGGEAGSEKVVMSSNNTRESNLGLISSSEISECPEGGACAAMVCTAPDPDAEPCTELASYDQSNFGGAI